MKPDPFAKIKEISSRHGRNLKALGGGQDYASPGMAGAPTSEQQ
jgi:hypothetical protein